VLNEDVVEAVTQWWNVQTRVSPNKKEVVRKRIPRGRTVEEHATHYLLESQVTSLLAVNQCFVTDFISTLHCVQLPVGRDVIKDEIGGKLPSGRPRTRFYPRTGFYRPRTL
jgi:hypothetical protein